MRAAVTEGPGVIRVCERPDPAEPAPGQTLLRVEAVGLCGSDLHFFHADLGPSHAGLLPRVQGHELSAVVTATDPAGSPFSVGERVAVWPVVACGECPMCLAGRGNVCIRLELVGIHRDGALQEHLVVPTGNVVATPGLTARQAALVEPVSIAVHAANRGRVASGERVLVFGGGPIGFASAVVVRDRGGEPVVVDPVESRRRRLAAAGFPAVWPADAAAAIVGDGGPAVVFDTTGRAAVLATAVDAAAHGGRVVVVGLTSEVAAFGPGPLPIKELDVLGTSCCTRAEFVEAADVVRRHATSVETLVSTALPLLDIAAAFELIESHPDEVAKVLIDVGAS